MIEEGTECDPESVKKILAGMTTELRFTTLSREVQKEQPIDVKRAVDILSQHIKRTDKNRYDHEHPCHAFQTV